MGIAQLIVSFPTGILADRYRRDTLLSLGAGFGVLAAIVTFTASIQKRPRFEGLGVGLALWGFFWGICNTSVSALFADSISDGDRSYYFAQRAMVQFLGNAFGPVTALGMFVWLGDEWTVGECSVVVCVGQCICFPALILLCFMNDDYCVDELDLDVDVDVDMDGDGDSSNHDEEALDNNDDHERNSGPLDSIVDKDHYRSQREAETETEIEIETEALINNNQVFDTTAHESESESQQKLLCIAPSRAVPVMVATADVLSGLAAGMSIRYFPIFFLENLKMSPTDVQITFIASMMCMAGMTKVVQKIGIKIGRLQITIICKWIGALLLLSMIQAYKSGQSAMTICTLYVLRTSFMNSCASLTKSVLMDHVPKEERAKWSSLESVNSFSWAGSAAVGGFLVDVEGILFNFSITTVLQLVATIPLILVFGRARSEN